MAVNEIDYQSVLDEIFAIVEQYKGRGKVANYIPALGAVDPSLLGMAVTTLKGETYTVGDAQTKFSIQSISKVFTLALAFALVGEDLWSRVGKEPSGSAFNSLVQLEYENGIPRNSFINAGALVTTDHVISGHKDPLSAILAFVRAVSGNPEVQYDNVVAESERHQGYRNAALVNFMKSFGNIQNPGEDVLNVYFHQCALAMSCVDLSKAFLFLANHGKNPFDDKQLLTRSQAKRVNALMQTCGLYDESGEFAFSVGLPGKSGVGGGIVALIPGSLAICVWAPELNDHGNSYIGMKAMELFTTRTGVSVF